MNANSKSLHALQIGRFRPWTNATWIRICDPNPAHPVQKKILHSPWTQFRLTNKLWKLNWFQMIGLKIVDDSLNKAFYKLGLVVGKHPGYFIIVPILLTCLGMTGYQKMHNNIDPEYLFSPLNGEGKQERAIVEEYFKVNYTSRFNVARITRAGRNINWLSRMFFEKFQSGAITVEQSTKNCNSINCHLVSCRG